MYVFIQLGKKVSATQFVRGTRVNLTAMVKRKSTRFHRLTQHCIEHVPLICIIYHLSYTLSLVYSKHAIMSQEVLFYSLNLTVPDAFNLVAPMDRPLPAFPMNGEALCLLRTLHRNWPGSAKVRTLEPTTAQVEPSPSLSFLQPPLSEKLALG